MEEKKEMSEFEKEESEFVAQNCSQIRIEKVVEFKIPKEYFDSFCQENEDSTNESDDYSPTASGKRPVNQLIDEIKKIGRYSISERSARIIKYKKKLLKRR